MHEGYTRYYYSYLTAEGEWMTENFVPFSGTLNFTEGTGTATLILRGANPSGLDRHAKEVGTPVSL